MLRLPKQPVFLSSLTVSLFLFLIPLSPHPRSFALSTLCCASCPSRRGGGGVSVGPGSQQAG